jgi:hypothetical protein
MVATFLCIFWKILYLISCIFLLFQVCTKKCTQTDTYKYIQAHPHYALLFWFYCVNSSVSVSYYSLQDGAYQQQQDWKKKSVMTVLKIGANVKSPKSWHFVTLYVHEMAKM